VFVFVLEVNKIVFDRAFKIKKPHTVPVIDGLINVVRCALYVADAENRVGNRFTGSPCNSKTFPVKQAYDG